MKKETRVKNQLASGGIRQGQTGLWLACSTVLLGSGPLFLVWCLGLCLGLGLPQL
jgi:hypothetical protein